LVAKAKDLRIPVTEESDAVHRQPSQTELHCPSKPENLHISNQVATLEVAKAEFEASWKQWKAWAGMEEVP
jgi:hypothetical protein